MEKTVGMLSLHPLRKKIKLDSEMKKYILISFLLFLFSFHKKQQLESEYILWSKDRKLRWDDFQGVPVMQDVDKGHDAATFSLIHVELNTYKDSFAISVSSRFIKSKSWKLTQTKFILNHEQRHFDMTEVYSRMFKKEIYCTNYCEMNIEEVNKFLINLTAKYTEALDSNGNLYDNEISYINNFEIQARWDAKIDSMLVNLDAYSSPRIIIKRNQNNNSNKDVQKNTKSNSPFQSVFK